VQHLIDVLNAATEELKKPRPAGTPGVKPTARDWKAFGQALANFFATILPMILPLFLTEDTE